MPDAVCNIHAEGLHGKAAQPSLNCDAIPGWRVTFLLERKLDVEEVDCGAGVTYGNPHEDDASGSGGRIQ